jgi:pyrroline-5-carboxylate reductase
MGSALLKSWIARRVGPIAVVEPVPNPELRKLARSHHIRLFDGIGDAASLPISACVVALKPQVLQTEARRLAPVARSGALMLSIAAGTSIAALRKAWGRDAAIIRAMPNLPGSIGRGISALYAPRGTTDRYRMLAQSLLAGLGETFWVSREELIDVVTAVSGSGPAYVFLFAECLANAARVQGFPAGVAARLARATVSGAGALLAYDPRGPVELRRDVTSPGGTTEAALKVLMEHEVFGRLVDAAVAAACARAADLRREAEAGWSD